MLESMLGVHKDYEHRAFKQEGFDTGDISCGTLRDNRTLGHLDLPSTEYITSTNLQVQNLHKGGHA